VAPTARSVVRGPLAAAAAPARQPAAAVLPAAPAVPAVRRGTDAPTEPIEPVEEARPPEQVALAD
jgi:hypothetical protein